MFAHPSPAAQPRAVLCLQLCSSDLSTGRQEQPELWPWHRVQLHPLLSEDSPQPGSKSSACAGQKKMSPWLFEGVTPQNISLCLFHGLILPTDHCFVDSSGSLPALGMLCCVARCVQWLPPALVTWLLSPAVSRPSWGAAQSPLHLL